ncbi:retrovirus-related pol polyprotein from transposon TNT 1-94 [Tanacetum coccineum]
MILKAQLQDKNIAISELKKLIEKCKGKSVETKIDKPSPVRQTNALKNPKPLVLGTPTIFSDSLKRKNFSKTKPVTKTNVIVQLILFIVDSGCTKNMTGNLKLLCNFVEKNLGNITIKRVYYVEGLNHNLFSVGQFCDADLEVAFGILLILTTSSTSICFMAKASPTQAWLWHRRLSHLNFDYINLLSKKDIVIGLPKLKYVKDQLCFSCELSKAKRNSFKTKVVPSSKGRLNLLHMDLCGPMHVESINGKKYILVIVDDYSRYTVLDQYLLQKVITSTTER